MITLHDLQAALAAHLGRVLTAEDAAELVRKAVEGENRAIDMDQFAPEHRPDGYTFAVERLADIRAEIHPLHVEHFAETERYRAHQGLNPAYEAMLRDERRGNLLQFTLRAPDGELVGNARFYLGQSRHTGSTFAQEDTYFVRAEHRKGFLALRFWQFAEKCLAKAGAVEVRTDSKLSNHVHKLNQYLGYTPVATKFVKELIA